MAKKAQDTQAQDTHSAQAAQARVEVPRTPEATLLLLMGFVTTAAGLGLSFGPKFSWKVEQISQGFAYLGIHGGTLIMGGLMLAGMGMIRRGLSLHLANDTRDVDYELSMNQIAVDLGDVRTTLLDFDERFRGMKAAMKMITAQIAESSKQDDSDGKGEDAIFRMAASVDQTWARMDKRMGELFDGLRKDIDGVHGELDETRTALKSVSQDVQSASERMENVVQTAAQQAAAVPAALPQAELVQAPEPAPQAPAVEPPAARAAAAPAPTVQAMQPNASLGVLDEMDDYDAPMPVDSHSQAQAAGGDDSTVEIHLDEPQATAQPGDGLDLSDEAVDEALRAMRRHAEDG